MTSNNDPTFIVVDLDIRSKVDLKPLGEHLEGRVLVQYNDANPEGGYLLSFAPTPARKIKDTPERQIEYLCELISTLPPHLLKLWKGASARVFDIGIRGGISDSVRNEAGYLEIRPYRGVIGPTTITLLATHKATLRITAYPFDPEPNHSMHQTLPLRGIAGDFES